MSRSALVISALAALTALLFTADMAVGSVPLTLGGVWEALLGRADAATVTIVRDIRLLKAVAAVLVGAALTVSGRQMQTLFSNPLAGPYVLGVTSGASLGVALALMGAPLLGASASGLYGAFGLAGAAWLGAVVVLAVMAVVASRVRDIMAVLILGMMFSAGTGALVQALQYLSHEDALKAFVVWSMGSLGEVTGAQMPLMAGAVAAGLLLACASTKALNLLALGEGYAASMGLSTGRARALLFASTTLLAGTVTAFCGPIGFIGMALPHVTSALMDTTDNRLLLPGNIFCGSAAMLLCDMLSKWLALPVNTVTALLGIPVIIVIVLRRA